MKRTVLCNRAYCYTEVKPCVFEGMRLLFEHCNNFKSHFTNLKSLFLKAPTWSDWSLCSSQNGQGTQVRKWLCNDDPDCIENIREERNCSSYKLKHMCKGKGHFLFGNPTYVDLFSIRWFRRS